MLYLKPANTEDAKKEWQYTRQLPADENGFTNDYPDISWEAYRDHALPELIDWSVGKNLPEDYVPCTTFFLWNDDDIVGIFRIRHCLNSFLRAYHGHIGYGIGKAYRGRGYAAAGLQLAIEQCRAIIKEDEIYLSVHKDNPASLRVQIKCGAYIDHEDEDNYYTRIPLRASGAEH